MDYNVHSAAAEAHIRSSTRRKYEDLNDDADIVESGEAKSEDGEEIFPAVGPFQCEICKEVSATKQMFVTHIKTRHRHSVDPEVLRSLELDLRKREEKIEKTVAGAKTRPRRKRGKLSVKVEADSEGEKFAREKRKYEHRQELQYVDLAGNILPKAAGKYPGEDSELEPWLYSII